MLYAITFKYSETTYCSNLAFADNAGVVRDHYEAKQYTDIMIRKAEVWELHEAERKGKPILDLEK